MADREDISNALYDLLRSTVWGVPARGFAYTSQRYQVFSDCPAQPALYLVDAPEQRTQVTRMPGILTLEFKVVVYQNDALDLSSTPKSTNNLILQALEDSLRACCLEDEPQTLGGRVARCWVEGEIFKDDGATDGQGIVVFTIKAEVP